MVLEKRKLEKEVWSTISPLLDLPPVYVEGKFSRDGMKKYVAARREIQKLVNDPLFVKKVQDGRATFRDYLFQNIPAPAIAKLLDTDNRALVRDRCRR